MGCGPSRSQFEGQYPIQNGYPYGHVPNDKYARKYHKAMYKEAKKRKNKKAYAAMIGANTAFIGLVVMIVHVADFTKMCLRGGAGC